MFDNSEESIFSDIKEISHEDFENICRSCLSTNGKVNLFYLIHEDMLLSDIYKNLSTLKCSESDGLPSKLCPTCADFVIQFHTFRKRTLNSELFLQSVLVKKEQAKEAVRVNVDNVTSFDVKPENGDEDVCDETEIGDCASDEQDEDDLEAKTVLSTPQAKRIKKKRNNSLTCPFCNITFDTYMEYKIHRKKEADRRRKKHPCSVCQKLISTYKLKDHINSHTKERPYQCDICGEKFRFRSSLTRHHFRHNDKKPHECHICGKGFIQAPTLTDHLRTHTGEKSFICNICGKCFVTKHALGNHINMHKIRDSNPDSDSDFACKICRRVFDSKTILKNHMFTHSEKEFLCSECGKKFSTKALLDSHLKVHSGIKPYVCEICNKAFSQKNSLQKHTLTHTGEKPVVCIVCGKRFSQKGHLTYHMRRHSGERPYSCTYCDKTFNHTGSLKVHIRIHTGEKPFVCDICSKGFYDSSSMKKHRRIHDELKAGLNVKMEVQQLNELQ